jgi:NADPH-dependent 2,4-dienoyl-CoA reductase/sulfur reductase-like enzyme
MSFNRRDFLKAGAAGIAVVSFPGLVFASSELIRKTGQRVVIVGAGFGGATAAKYIRKWSNNRIEVVLIERNPVFISCPMSNTVLGGTRTIDDLTVGYDTLQKKYGIKLINGEVTAIDPEKQAVMLDSGHVSYDRLIVSPGVDFMYDRIDGLDARVANESILHAWKAGAQTVMLRRQLEAMPDGGVFAISIPKKPYRCPPGPYERACQVAYYFKNNKPGSKVLILDANPEVISKKGLFTAAWNDLYGGIVEYRPNSAVVKVDVATTTATTEFGNEKVDVLNVLPPMRAGLVADMAGLANVDARWCGVDFLSYESGVRRNIHVIGDAIDYALPRSAHMATSQAKVCAAAIIELLQGNQPDQNPVMANTCYSMVSGNEAMHVADVFRYDSEKKVMIAAAGGGVSTNRSELEGRLAGYWLKNILGDALL